MKATIGLKYINKDLGILQCIYEGILGEIIIYGM